MREREVKSDTKVFWKMNLHLEMEFQILGYVYVLNGIYQYFLKCIPYLGETKTSQGYGMFICWMSG